MEMPQAPSEERTAHHVRRLHATIRDLQNALGVYAKAERPPRPPRASISLDTAADDDPLSRIAANNERGAVQRIERVQEIGAAVLGLQGVGALVADALCRYGVKRLVVADTTEIGVGDLDFMTRFVQDLGKRREDLVATTVRRLDPEIDVFALGLPLSRTALVVEALRGMLSESDDDDDDDDSDGSAADGGTSDDGAHDGDSDYARSDGDDDTATRSERSRHEAYSIYQNAATFDRRCFDVVFLCGVLPELALGLNELCCEFGVQLVYVAMGPNGISGDSVSVVPGRSSCLQCLEKRKVLKLSSSAAATEASVGDAVSPTSTFGASLPTTECVLAGIAVQHAFANILGAGPICSRVEYDGYLEELDRSGFIAPVHQCPSAFCRHQQQQQSPAAAATHV